MNILHDIKGIPSIIYEIVYIQHYTRKLGFIQIAIVGYIFPDIH
jgi:hypothetical protein